MRLLLDTHCWLWMRSAPERLSQPTREMVRDPETELYLSAASAWEIAIKVALGKLRLPQPPSVYVVQRLAQDSVTPLPILHGHALRAGELPPHHRDPFDRVLIAQAQIEKLTLLTTDREIARYDVPVHWA